MHSLKWSKTHNDIKYYESLKQTLINIEDISFRNNDSDCNQLMRLACMLYLQRDNINKYLSEDNDDDKFINNYWLRKKRERKIKLPNFWVIAKDKNCDCATCMKKLFNTYCKKDKQI